MTSGTDSDLRHRHGETLTDDGAETRQLGAQLVLARGDAGEHESPVGVLVAARVRPVPVLRSVSATPGSVPPDASDTIPVMVADVCAYAGVAASTATQSHRSAIMMGDRALTNSIDVCKHVASKTIRSPQGEILPASAAAAAENLPPRGRFSRGNVQVRNIMNVRASATIPNPMSGVLSGL